MIEIRKTVFWIGVLALVVGGVLFGYGSLMIPGLFEKLRYMRTDLVEMAVNTGMGSSPFQVVEQLFLMQLLQLIGLGLAVSGAVMLVRGLGVKKENKNAGTAAAGNRLGGRV